jgi:hypothetical protein
MNIKKANQKLQKWIEARAKSDNLDLNDLTSAAGLALPYIFNGNLSLNGNLQTNHEIGPICFSSLFYLFSSRNRRSISEKIWISKELTAVVAEGDFEPRSIGSFTLRFYRADDGEAKRGLDADDFAGGILRERDGQIEKVELLDLDGDSTNELIISARSAGSGGYLSGFAVGLMGKNVEVLAQDLGMLQDADVASELRKILQEKSKKQERESRYELILRSLRKGREGVCSSANSPNYY